MKRLKQRFSSGTIGATLMLSALLNARGADVAFIGIIKLQRFEQLNVVGPSLLEFDELSPDDTAPFMFNAFIDLASTNAVTNATVTIPKGLVHPLGLSEDGFTREFSDVQEFKPDLDGVYSNSTYTLFLQTQNDGDKTLLLTFSSGEDYPNPPRISNWTAAQSIDPTTGFTLTWDPFIGGQDTDFVQLEVFDSDTDTSYGETPGPGEPGSLDGTSTSVLISGGTLPSGRTLDCRLLFARILDVDDTTYGGGVAGVAAFVVETRFQLRTTGGTDLNPPTLLSSIPQNMQTAISARTPVSFSFSETMNSGLPVGSSITWSANLNANLLTYSWSAADQALFCVYPPGFPTNELITWTLNPGGSPQDFRDLAGNKLPSQSGAFTTGITTDIGVTDLQSVALAKGRVFRQTSNGVMDLASYQFDLTPEMNVANTITNAQLTLPNARTVTAGPDFGDSLEFTAQYSSQDQLDLFYPDGTYQVASDLVHDGARSFSMSLSGNTYPNAPRIQDYAGAQSVNPSNAFVLSWDNFTDGTVTDFIGLDIESDDDYLGSVFQTPDFSEQSALVGTNTSVTLPAFTLAPGRTYHGELVFAKVSQVDTNTFPGVPAVAAYFSATEFELNTVGETIHPSLKISRIGNSTAHITVTGERNRLYTIESSDSITSGRVNWHPWTWGYANTNGSGFTGSFDFDDALPPFIRTRFYRAHEGFSSGVP